MGIVCKDGMYLIPQAYFNVLHEHQPMLALESSPVVNIVDPWSMINMNTVTKLDADGNKMTLNDGRELTYKALVLAPGLDTHVDHIDGLKHFDDGHEDNNVFVHCLDSKERAVRNFYNGYFARGGDLLCYSPAYPYKGEGTDFYALYYESLLR